MPSKLKGLPILAVALVFASPLIAAPRDGDPTTLVAFADAFDRAQLAKDGPALANMVSDDLIFIDGSGKRLGKQAFIDGWTAREDLYDPIVLTDRSVVPLGPDAGIVGAETVLSGTSGGKRFSSRFRFADTFRRIGGHWRAVHIQVTRIP